MSKHQVSHLYYHQLWLAIGWSIIILVIYLSLNKGGIHLPSDILNDKMGHALGYFSLMLWFTQIYKSFKHRALLAISFVLLGISLEFLQKMGGVRAYEVADMVANTTGVLLGWLAAYLGLDRILAWFELRVLSRS